MSKSAASSTLAGEKPTFEQALATLEAIAHDLEEGRIGLAEALGRYEEGVKLLKQCYELLEHAERRIELLNRVGASGEAVTQPLDDAALSLEEKAASRGRRRSRPTAAPPCEEVEETKEDNSRGLF